MTGRRQAHRGHRRDALFDWTAEGDAQPGEVRDNPLLRSCTHCHAGVGQPCTRPTAYRSRTGGGRTACPPHDARRTPAPSTREATTDVRTDA